MTRITNFLLVSACLCLLTPVKVIADDFADIRLVLQKYLDGTSQGKPELVQEAFLPTLEIQYVWSDGVFRQLKGTDYIARIKKGEAVARIGTIHSIDVSGNAATAKVEIVWGERIYTDFMLLLKTNDGWHISNKIASRRPR